jgi:type I restriction enzyme R subunit
LEYDAADMEPIQGAFYATTSLKDANFRLFREEDRFDLEKD